MNRNRKFGKVLIDTKSNSTVKKTKVFQSNKQKICCDLIKNLILTIKIASVKTLNFKKALENPKPF